MHDNQSVAAEDMPMSIAGIVLGHAGAAFAITASFSMLAGLIALGEYMLTQYLAPQSSLICAASLRTQQTWLLVSCFPCSGI